MSVSKRQGDGGGFPGGDSFPSFNFTIPHARPRPANTTISITSYVTSATTSTFSTTSHQTTTESTIITSTVPITIIPTSSLAAESSALHSAVSLTKANTIIASVLGGFIILLIIVLALVLFLWIRRRRREREDESPPFTSLAPNAPASFSPATTQSAPQLPRQATSLSMGPTIAVPFSPNRNSFSRPFSAPVPTGPPTIPAMQNLPAINIQPNTPTVTGRDDSGPISPILQPSAARAPVYHQTLQEGASDDRARGGAENSGRLGPPLIRGAQRGSVSASVSTMGSDMVFEHNVEAQDQRIQHSTRASSGVFPESHSIE